MGETWQRENGTIVLVAFLILVRIEAGPCNEADCGLVGFPLVFKVL